MKLLAQLIDDYIKAKRVDGKPSSGFSKFRVSDAGRCHLMRFWKRQGKPHSCEIDARTQRVFEVGHIFHNWLQDILTERGLLLEREMKVEDKHRIGHIDAIVKDGEKIVLYDFKTVHSRKFGYENNTDMHYKHQIVTYATMLPFKVNDLRIVYISKDDLRIGEVSVDYDSLITNVKNDWETMIDYWESRKQPKPNPMSWECQWCIYRGVCEHNKNGI